MATPISLRLDDAVRAELEALARSRGIGLATLLRDLANAAAREALRSRIRQASAVVGARVATSADAQAFYEDWGHRTPMSANDLVLHAGQIVLADWRGGSLPREPNKRRPAVVVEDDGLFAPAYPNAILVPLTEDGGLAIPDLAVAIAPTAENGCRKPCWAVSHLVATHQRFACMPRPPVLPLNSLMTFASRSLWRSDLRRCPELEYISR